VKLPEVPGYLLFHAHEEGETCHLPGLDGIGCRYRATAWTRLVHRLSRLRTRLPRREW